MEYLKKYPKLFQWLFLLIIFFVDFGISVDDNSLDTVFGGRKNES